VGLEVEVTLLPMEKANDGNVVVIVEDVEREEPSVEECASFLIRRFGQPTAYPERLLPQRVRTTMMAATAGRTKKVTSWRIRIQIHQKNVKNFTRR
jgi:hypothetical protein